MSNSTLEAVEANVVSHAEWVTARKQLLKKEKEFTRLRDELSRERRGLPWEKVEKAYQFDSARGKVTLSDLFDGRGQLLIYHFMFAPEWEQGCSSCSLVADHFDGTLLHLANRDTTLVVVSRAPMEKIEAFKKRMEWKFEWVSSFGSDFNFDYGVSFAPEDRAEGRVYYNYSVGGFPQDEAPGASVFTKGEDGELFHTYSTYARGLDILMGTYNLLDLVPKGRDEQGLGFTMSWVRHHDRYPQGYFVDRYPEGFVVPLPERPEAMKGSCCGSAGKL